MRRSAAQACCYRFSTHRSRNGTQKRTLAVKRRTFPAIGGLGGTSSDARSHGSRTLPAGDAGLRWSDACCSLRTLRGESCGLQERDVRALRPMLYDANRHTHAVIGNRNR